jgi:hypothetical protein
MRHPVPVRRRRGQIWPWALGGTAAGCGVVLSTGPRADLIIMLVAGVLAAGVLVVLLGSRSPRPSCAHCGARGCLHQAGAQYDYRWYCDDYLSCEQRAAVRGVSR